MKEPLEERIERWLDYAALSNIPLERILLHQSDREGMTPERKKALEEYYQLPIVWLDMVVLGIELGSIERDPK